MSAFLALGRLTGVKAHARAEQIGRGCRWALAAALVFTLGGARNVFAESMSRWQNGAAAGHDCKCGMKCRGGSCCCGPNSAETGPAAPESTSNSSRDNSGPCLSSAPCGDPALPNASPGGPVKMSLACESPASGCRCRRTHRTLPRVLHVSARPSLSPGSATGTAYSRLIPGHHHQRISASHAHSPWAPGPGNARR